MTTAKPTTAKTPAAPGQGTDRFRLPDPPERHPDEKMTSAKHLHEPGNTHHLAQHFANPETTIVAAERYVTMMPERRLPSGSYRRVPDLLIALEVDRAAYYASNGYIVSEQGKPPDFALEVASASTAEADTGPKRADYAALGITECWRFDETGEHHGTRLAGERLVDGVYVATDIEQLPDGSLQGYSVALDLHLRWEGGRLLWIDPATDRHIATFESEREGRLQERAARAAAEARADTAEARVRELKAELSRLRGS